MPQTSEKMLAQLGISKETATWDSMNSNNEIPENTKVISKGEPLFVRLDREEEIEYIKNAMKK